MESANFGYFFGAYGYASMAEAPEIVPPNKIPRIPELDDLGLAVRNLHAMEGYPPTLNAPDGTRYDVQTETPEKTPLATHKRLFSEDGSNEGYDPYPDGVVKVDLIQHSPDGGLEEIKYVLQAPSGMSESMTCAKGAVVAGQGPNQRDTRRTIVTDRAEISGLVTILTDLHQQRQQEVAASSLEAY